MLVKDAIAEAAALTGQIVTQETALRWLSELDGEIALEFYFAEAWAPYTADDLESELAVPFPWDGLYVHHLEAMTYFTNGEYERYENARAMAGAKMVNFKKHVQRMKTRCGEISVPLGGDSGSGVTVVGKGQGLWRYISAYGTAVRCGFTGTPEEWLASLVGGDGMHAPDYDPTEAVRDAGGIPAYLSANYQAKLSFDEEPTEDSPNPVESGGVYAALADIETGLAGKQAKVRTGTVALSATWTGEGPYTQTVTVTGAVVTSESRVDLQPTAAQLAALMTDGVTALVIGNDNGTLTAYAVGAETSEAMTIQATVTEVSA